MLPNNHLQLFAQQLATWAAQIIENGRTPFRRVDLFHQLHTATGPCHPPLIFWINRQSMIAGGLLFLPDNSTDSSFRNEAAAAASLGLRHFVTWEENEINIWETVAEVNILVTSLPLIKTQDPAVFHHRLYEVIDLLKLLSVTGRINAEEMSSYYLLNLLEETQALSFPTLLEFCRIQQSENTSIITPEEEAQNWNRLTLLRLLCLLHWDLLPANLPLPQLATSAEELLSGLPAPLGEILLTLHPEASLNLPDESAVAFHHLLLRLQQINWRNQDNRGDKTFRLLLMLWYGEPPPHPRSNSRKRLLIHSQELAPSCTREISQSGAQLAANTLMRVLKKEEHPTQLQGDAFKISTPFEEKILHANFYGSQRPDQSLRRELTGHLRHSWPNRRLNIPGSLPFWATEAAHFLGLTPVDSQVELHLPANWLRLLIGTFFTELIFSNFVLERIDCRDEKRHLLVLHRSQNETATECLLADKSSRSIELGLDPMLAACSLQCALELPTRVFTLFLDQQLVFLEDSGAEACYPEALASYAKSSLGQQLWAMRTETEIPKTAEKLLTEGVAWNWLVPEATYLQELKPLSMVKDITTIKPQTDHQLSQLLGIDTENSNIQYYRLNAEPVETTQINRNLGEELLKTLEIEGIPHFPQTYLYRQATGPLTCYKFSPPLKLRHELLGQYEFVDEKGHQLQVTGEETKEALQLASLLGMTTLEIPLDRQQTAEMLDSYRQDLSRLQESIVRLCHQHIEQSSAAQRMQKKLWQQLPLPPIKWLSS